MPDSDFHPQFHALLQRRSDGNLWVALPLPYTEVPFKAAFHQACRRDEWRRLTAEGAAVLALPLSM